MILTIVFHTQQEAVEASSRKWVYILISSGDLGNIFVTNGTVKSITCDSRSSNHMVYYRGGGINSKSRGTNSSHLNIINTINTIYKINTKNTKYTAIMAVAQLALLCQYFGCAKYYILRL